MTVAWRITPGQCLQYRRWDGDCVLYNDISGSTHLLPEENLALLFALRDGNITADELAEPDVAALLAQLQHLLLVQNRPC